MQATLRTKLTYVPSPSVPYPDSVHGPVDISLIVRLRESAHRLDLFESLPVSSTFPLRAKQVSVKAEIGIINILHKQIHSQMADPQPAPLCELHDALTS